MMKARKGFAIMNQKNCTLKMATTRSRINRADATTAPPAPPALSLRRGNSLACPRLSR
jgi:hypothetical protein